MKEVNVAFNLCVRCVFFNLMCFYRAPLNSLIEIVQKSALESNQLLCLL